MLPVFNQSVRDARAHFQIGHQDIRTYYSDATVAAAATTTTRTTAIATNTTRTTTLLQDIRQRYQCARTRMVTLSTTRTHAN
jgi:hypothetical protein